MASTKELERALYALKKAEGGAHVVAMSEVFGALRKYALKYGWKMRDLHEMNKAIRGL
jgi:hypothetical protein